jgi:hypothetical protein
VVARVRADQRDDLHGVVVTHGAPILAG